MILTKYITRYVGITSGEGMGRDMTDAFYKSARWKKKRKAILKRDKFLCVECCKYGRRRDATTVHHIKELEHYPELAFVDSNLVSLCEACHNKQHPEKGGSMWRKKCKT